MQSSIVAMVLAGGQGTRLGVLTEDIAKPAVPFGGKYRIIDFALSNCVNSGIYKVGVLTQYKPHKLNAHIGIGRPWDLDRKGGGVTVLQPYTYESGKAWFKGTADALYENLDYLDKTNPKYVLVLSGDHIYGMDYMDMLTFHISKHAKASCACMNVPLNETYRFGIMVTDISKRIVEFQEKPQHAKSTLASLGIYIFNWDYLREALIQDAKDESSSHDFGKDIIPKMVEDKDDLYAFEYEGHWRDVGTIYSYWESNLELIQSIPQLNLYNDSWRFYTRTEEMPPAFFGKDAVCTNSLVSEGCEIHGVLNKSILFQGVQVGKGSIIKDSIILTGVKIGDGVEISNAVIAEDTEIGSGTKIGVGDFAENEENPSVYNSQISVIGYQAKVPENAIIGKNCVIHSGVTHESTDDWQVQSGRCVR